MPRLMILPMPGKDNFGSPKAKTERQVEAAAQPRSITNLFPSAPTLIILGVGLSFLMR